MDVAKSAVKSVHKQENPEPKTARQSIRAAGAAVNLNQKCIPSHVQHILGNFRKPIKSSAESDAITAATQRTLTTQTGDTATQELFSAKSVADGIPEIAPRLVVPAQVHPTSDIDVEPELFSALDGQNVLKTSKEKHTTKLVDETAREQIDDETAILGNIDDKQPPSKTKKPKKAKKKKRKPVTVPEPDAAQKPYEERFVNDNNSVEFESPSFDSPKDSERYIHSHIYDVQLGGSQYQWPNTFSKYAVIFTTVCTFLNLFRFPELVFNHGGMYFFIPYCVCAWGMALPVAFMELVLGQYASLPPATLYSRMGPMFAGIGYTMTLVKVALAWSEFSHKTVFNLITSIVVMKVDRATWTSCIAMPSRDCCQRFLNCSKDEYAYLNQCYNIADEMGARTLTYEQVMTVMSGSSVALRVDHTDEYQLEEYYTKFSVFTVTSALLAGLVYGLVLVRGMKAIVAIAIMTTASSLVLLLGAAIPQMFMSHYSKLWQLIYPGDPSILYSYAAWKEAALFALTSYNVADGSLILIGSMNHFRNNILKDVFFMGTVGFFGNTISLFITFPLVIMLSESMFANQVGMDLSLRQKIMLLGEDWIDMVQRHMITFFGVFQYGPLICLFFCIGLFLVTVGVQALTGEMVLATMYRTFPSLLLIEEVYYRKFFGIAYIAWFLLFCMLTANPTYYMVWNDFVKLFLIETALPWVAFFEIMMIMYRYKFARLMTNIKTMKQSELLNFVWNLAMVTWCFLSPALLFLTALLAMVPLKGFHHMFSPLVRAAGFVLVFIICTWFVWLFLYKLLSHKIMKKNIRLLFECHKSWGPRLTDDRNKAEADERAARVR